MKKILTAVLSSILLICSLSFIGCSTAGIENQITIYKSDSAVSMTASEVIESIKLQSVDIYGTSSTFTSSGSGVIISSDDDQSYIITNHHVIDECTALSVEVRSFTDDGDEVLTACDNVDFIGGSPQDDIAVLRIDMGNLPCATWIEDSDDIEVGTEVYAVGNQLGLLSGTVTSGIISGVNREVSVTDVGTLTNLLQTDAAINGGSSGGGLFSTDGTLLGINSASYSSYQGLYFAIPANNAVKVFQSLVDTYSENANGSINNYGYVEWASTTGFNVANSYCQLYTDSNKSSQNYYLYTDDPDSYSSASEKDVTADQAIIDVLYDSNGDGTAESHTCFGNTTAIISSCYSNITGILSSLTANETIQIVCANITTISGRDGYSYVGSETTYTLTAEQFVYVFPNE